MARRLRAVGAALGVNASARLSASASAGASASASASAGASASASWAQILAEYPDDVAPAPHPGWAPAFILVNGVRLRYFRTPGGTRADGSPKPVVVLSHGMGDNGLSWWYLLGEQTHDFELISIEARGHGLSDPPTEATPPDAQAEDIAAVIEALGLVKPIVMGHSMGSASTMWFAARYPDVPLAVVLEDPQLRFADTPPPSGPSTEARASGFTAAEIFRKNNMSFSELLENSRENIAASWGSEQPPVAEMVARWAQRGHQMVAKQQHHPYAATWSQNSRARGGRPAAADLFESIAAPTLILKQDDQGETRATNVAVAARLKHASSAIVHVQGAGHNVRRDQKERTLAALLPFLHAVCGE
jgi:pimeloyl-ACP methyl ester carboxylesterase